MKYLKLSICLVFLAGMTSCAETTQQDNATHNEDTMVIKENITDSATTTITTDTTRR